MLFCISFRRRAHWLDNHILYPTGTIHSYYNTIDYILYAVIYISMTIL